MRYRISSVLCLVVLFGLSTAPGLGDVVPQFVLGGGYEFVIIAANKSRAPHTIEFELLEDYHQPWSIPFSVNGQPRTGNLVRITLGAHSVEKLRLTGGNSPNDGYLRVTEEFTFRGFVSPSAIQFFYEFRQDGEVVDSVGGAFGLATFMNNALAFPVERNSSVNTGFALAPWSLPELSQAAFSYTLRLFDENGNQVGLETFTFEGHIALFFDEVFPGVPEEFLGWVSIEVSGGMFDDLCVTVLRQELTSNGFQLTNVRPDFGMQSQLP